MNSELSTDNHNADVLAIASIPMQKRKNVYFPDTALKEGTIFPELNLPFFATDPVSETASTCNCDSCECMEENKKYAAFFTNEHFNREEVMQALYEISFFLTDLTLYLDTHKDDETAMKVFNKYNDDHKKLLQRMEVDFFPLLQCSIVDCKGNDNHFSWSDGPLPWEGARI